MFHRTSLIWRFNSGVVRENFSNFWMISSDGFIRINPPDWAFDVEPDHVFFDNIYYSVATPENNPSGKDVWTPVYYDSVLKKWMISLIIPLYDKNLFLGVTGSDLPIADLLEDLSAVNRAETGMKIFIFDKNNNIIMHPDYMDTILSQKGVMSSLINSESIANNDLKNFINEFNDGKHGYQKIMHYKDNGQVMEGIAYGFDDFLDWRFVAYKSHKAIDSQITRLKVKAVLLMLILGLVLAFSIRMIAAKLIIERLDSLARAATAFEAGENYSFTPGRNDEIGLLAHTFKQMSETIGKQIVALQDENSNRKAAESNLEKLRIYLASIIDSMPSALVGVDADMKVTLWNSTVEQITGIGVKNAQDKNLLEVLPQLVPQQAKINDSLKSRKIITGLKTQRAVGDHTHHEDITIYPLKAHGINEAVIKIDDVTKQTLIEQQLIQSRKMDAIGQLAGGIAHDFNNMLAGIVGSAEVLKLDEAKYSEMDLKMLDTILKAALRASGLTKKLLAFSRKGSIYFTTIDIHSIITDTVDLLKRTVDKKISISVEFKADSLLVTGDSSELQNAFMNICINASQAMPDGGDIKIETRNIVMQVPLISNPVIILRLNFQIQVWVYPLSISKEFLSRFLRQRSRGKGQV